jgi:hypothetical protein
MQMMKARSLDGKVAPVSGDDLLKRAEWLLKEKDKAAVTLEQMAQMLAKSEETGKETPAEAVESVAETGAPAAKEGEEVAAPAVADQPTEGQEVAAAPEVAVEPEIPELGYEDMEFTEADFVEEGEPYLDTKKPGKKKKAGKKGRQPTQEDWLTQIGRLKGRPGLGDWEDVENL